MTALVRLGVIEADRPPAGAFRSHAVLRGRVPAWLHRSFGTYCADTGERVLALTYDDGPDPHSTPAVLDTLRRYDEVATFFVLADAARRFPGVVRRIVSEGHEVALHGIDHRSLLRMTTAQARRTLRDARDAVAQISGRPVRLFRPPYGQITVAQARVVRRLGMTLVIWSGVAGDWIDAPVETIVGNVIARVFPGSILLLHDTRADPELLEPDERLPAFDRAEVLHRILLATKERGYRTRTVSGLLAEHPRVHSLSRERMRMP